MGNDNLQWVPSRSGKEGHEALMFTNAQGKEFQMGQLFPSQTGNEKQGYTLAMHDMNKGFSGRFSPQQDKSWNMAYDACRDKGMFAARQQIDVAHQLTGDRSQSLVQDQAVQQESGQPEPKQEVELER